MRLKSVRILGLFLLITLGAYATLLAVSGGPTPAKAALSTSWYAAAPYYMPLDNNPPDISTVMNATGQKSVMLAFILANGSSCSPAWGGNIPLSNSTISSVISTIRSKGGDVNVSAGGYGGTKLGQVCSDAASTAAAYQQVINAYNLKAFDLDLEEPEIENSAAIAREIGAAQILQRNNPGLYLSITIPSISTGANYFGKLLIQNAAQIGYTPNNFSLMTFDGVGTANDAMNAQNSFHTQLQEIYPNLSSAQIWNLQGFSLMNGHTDTAEHFTQADFQTLLNFTKSHGMGRYTYWSVNRDRQCPGNADILSGSCSGVAQNDWDFTRFTVAFASDTTIPPTTVPTTPVATATPTQGSGCAAPYNNTAVYTGGMQVSYNGHNWTAKWWTQGEAPSTGGSGVWADNGTCGGSNPTATPVPPTKTPVTTVAPTPTPTQTSGTTSWVANHTYTIGNIVTYNGVSYKCIQAHTSLVGWEPPNVPALWQKQ